MLKARKKKRKYFVIGCGSIAKRHIRNLIELDCKDIIAYDPRADRRKEAEALGARAVKSVCEGYALRPQAVLVMTPTGMHLKDCLEAVRNNCDVFVEKPVAHASRGIGELIKLVRQKKRVFLAGCNLRFHPGLKKVKKTLESGALGKIWYIRAQSGRYLPDWHPWEDYRKSYSANRSLGGGILLDGVHEIDYIQWLNGRIKSVSAIVKKLSRLEIDTEDMVELIFEFENGSVGSVHLDYLQRVSSRGCQVYGENGSIVWSFPNKTVQIYSVKTGKWSTYKDPAGFDYNQTYIDEMRYFNDCLDKRIKTGNSVEFAAEIVRVTEKARKASRRGGIKV